LGRLEIGQCAQDVQKVSARGDRQAVKRPLFLIEAAKEKITNIAKSYWIRQDNGNTSLL
jgi:hypothetical protein